MTELELSDLRVCDECGTIYDYYTTTDCPTCEKAMGTCQDCGGEILIELEWGPYFLENINYECDGCGRSGTAEVNPKG